MAVKKDQVLSQTANLQQGIINNNPVRFNEEHYDVDKDPTDNKRPLSTSAGDSPGTGVIDINSLGLDKKADLVNGKVPESQLPSYVDDVLEYASVSNFPSIGESGKIYVALDTNITYRWSGSAYVQVGPEGNIVIANPTLVGDEDDLTSLQVGETKYKVPSGHLYLHVVRNVSITFQGTSFSSSISLLLSNDIEIKNISTLVAALRALGYTSSLSYYQLNRVEKNNNDATKLINCYGIYASTLQNKVFFKFYIITTSIVNDAIEYSSIDTDSDVSSMVCYDTVIQIL